MSAIREGSIVDLTIKEATGVGSSDITYSSVTIAADPAKDVVAWTDSASNTFVAPWVNVRKIKVTTF
jgi:hypothetical protein